MIAVDSSVLVAGFASWHEQHDEARRALVGARVVGHALVEAYSVLTRLPSPHRAPADVAAAFLERVSAGAPLVLAADAWRALPGRLSALGISGGASYDALIAATALACDAELLSLDGRAAPTYRAVGVRYRMLDRD